MDHNDYIYASCILKDGTKITLQDWGNGGWGEEHYKLLDPESPIVLEEVLCVQMPDGTKIYMDGTVEYDVKASPPAAALHYLNNASGTDVYAYYADFDGEEVEDFAVWYDGAFRAVCLLKETGEAKTIVFGLTGTGYFDMLAYQKFHDGLMTDYAPTQEELEKSFANLPKVE